MKKFWIIASVLFTIGGVVFAYGRRFIGKLSFDIDFVPQITNFNSSGSFVMPFRVFVDNKNKKSVTVKDLDVKIYDLNNKLLAESDNKINSYKIEGFKNNKFDIDFKLYLGADLFKLVKDKLNNKKVEVYLIATFNIFLIPISIKETITLN